MVSQEVQDIIRTFGVDKFGEPLFFPDAGKQEDALYGREAWQEAAGSGRAQRAERIAQSAGATG